MRWSKIKNIIILLLVVVNLFLLALVGSRAWRSRQNRRETRERMVDILAANGVSYLPGEVPDAMELTGSRVTLASAGEAEAKALLGDLSDARTVGGRTTYTGALGRAVFSASGEMEVQFDPGARPLEGRDMGACALELLSTLGMEARETSRDAATVTFTQLLSGAPAPGETMVFTFEDEALTGFSGRRLVGTAEPVAAGETITASTALLRFLDALNRGGYVCSQVTELYAGYSVSGSGSVTLTPAWFVETDAWPWRFAVDAATGAVTAG